MDRKLLARAWPVLLLAAIAVSGWAGSLSEEEMLASALVPPLRPMHVLAAADNRLIACCSLGPPRAAAVIEGEAVGERHFVKIMSIEPSVFDAQANETAIAEGGVVRMFLNATVKKPALDAQGDCNTQRLLEKVATRARLWVATGGRRTQQALLLQEFPVNKDYGDFTEFPLAWPAGNSIAFNYTATGVPGKNPAAMQAEYEVTATYLVRHWQLHRSAACGPWGCSIHWSCDYAGDEERVFSQAANDSAQVVFYYGWPRAWAMAERGRGETLLRVFAEKKTPLEALEIRAGGANATVYSAVFPMTQATEYNFTRINAVPHALVASQNAVVQRVFQNSTHFEVVLRLAQAADVSVVGLKLATPFEEIGESIGTASLPSEALFLNVSAKTAFAGQGLNATAFVFSDGGVPVAGREVKFRLISANASESNSVVFTNASGAAQAGFTMPAGNALLEASASNGLSTQTVVQVIAVKNADGSTLPDIAQAIAAFGMLAWAACLSIGQRRWGERAFSTSLGAAGILLIAYLVLA